MNIFVSYARIDKPLCVEIVNTLGAYDVWYDQRLYAGQHWWKEILRRLEWCNVFIYLISRDSIKSPYCRKELEIAKKLRKHILPVLIDTEVKIPDDIHDVQYVDMTSRLDAGNVSMLHNSILMIPKQENSKSGRKPRPLLQTAELRMPINNSTEMIGNAARAFENGEYDQAILLFKQAISKKVTSRFINIEKMLEAAESALATQTRRREAEREYRQISELFKYDRTREFGCDALQKFREIYPDYDPDNLNQKCAPVPEYEHISENFLDSELLPMLKWCSIPGGVVSVVNTGTNEGHLREKSVKLASFFISKYPITNLQFQQFIEANDGYSNHYWWQFSDYATAWFEDHQKPLDSRYTDDDRPRENVTWYEAMAFTRWMSHTFQKNITLPRIAQWQRAAQGDDDRFYPWGNVFHEAYCNTHESEIKSTTSVTRYDKGASPYGVYDMAGNVWEWCMDRTEPEEGSFDYRRAVLGGSFVSPADRAQISFRYYLKPDVRYSSIGFRIVCMSNSANMSHT